MILHRITCLWTFLSVRHASPEVSNFVPMHGTRTRAPGPCRADIGAWTDVYTCSLLAQANELRRIPYHSSLRNESAVQLYKPAAGIIWCTTLSHYSLSNWELIAGTGTFAAKAGTYNSDPETPARFNGVDASFVGTGQCFGTGIFEIEMSPDAALENIISGTGTVTGLGTFTTNSGGTLLSSLLPSASAEYLVFQFQARPVESQPAICGS